jgi:hypothetical protein
VDKLLKIVKLTGIGLIIGSIVMFYTFAWRPLVNRAEKAELENARLVAEKKPTHLAPETIVMIDTAKVAELKAVIDGLRLKILKYARTPAETVEVEILAKDSIPAALAGLPCDKILKADTLYRQNGIAAYIGAMAFCGGDSITLDIGGYAEPQRPPFIRFHDANIDIAPDNKQWLFSGSARWAIRGKYLIGPAVVNNKPGLSFGLRF